MSCCVQHCQKENLIRFCYFHHSLRRTHVSFSFKVKCIIPEGLIINPFSIWLSLIARYRLLMASTRKWSNDTRSLNYYIIRSTLWFVRPKVRSQNWLISVPLATGSEIVYWRLAVFVFGQWQLTETWKIETGWHDLELHHNNRLGGMH